MDSNGDQRAIRNDTVAFVKECEKHSIHILGLDAFRIIDNEIQPVQELGGNFKSDNKKLSRSDIYKTALGLIKNEDNLYYEIITE